MTRRAKISVLSICSAVFVLLCCIIVLPHFIRASAYSPMNACVDNLQRIKIAKEQWELEHGKTTNDVPTWEDLRPYFPKDMPNGRDWTNGRPICPGGGTYTIGRIGELPRCTIRYHTLDISQMP
jgi:hypothetical protein